MSDFELRVDSVQGNYLVASSRDIYDLNKI